MSTRPLVPALRSLVSAKITIAAAAIIVLFVFGQVISPGFLSFGHLMSVLRLSVFLGIVALGQSLVVIAGVLASHMLLSQTKAASQDSSSRWALRKGTSRDERRRSDHEEGSP